MTNPSAARRTGPFTGTGALVTYPFDFRVYADTDVAVTVADTDGVEVAGVLNSTFLVTLNVDQEADPGGSVQYAVGGVATALPTGYTLAIDGAAPYSQEVSLPQGGSYNAKAVERALDRLSMQIQQVRDQVLRAVQISVLSPDDTDLTLPVPSASAIIGWTADGTALRNYDPDTSVSTDLLEARLLNPSLAAQGTGLLGHGDAVDYLTPLPNSAGAKLQIIMRSMPLSAWKFGVKGNDNEGSLVDESTAMSTAIAAALAERRELILPGTNYLFGGLSIPDTMTAFALRGEPTNRPVLHITQAEADAGGYILSAINHTTVSVTITADIVTGQQRIQVSSTAGLSAGMMVRWASSQLWYYDPRAQWYKGEIHMIGRIVDGTTIELEDQAWDTYDISVETLTCVAYTPRRFSLSDLHFKGKAPATNISTVLLQARALYMPEFDRLKFEMASSVGAQIGFSWFSKFRDIETHTIGRNSSLGYGLHDVSSVGTLIDGLKSRGCRRAVDFSSFTGTSLSAPARKGRVTNFDVSGNGTEAYGGAAFEPQGAVPSFGVGAHGPSEDLVFDNGRISSIGNGITVRGRNTTVSKVKFAGEIDACIEATYGTGLNVDGCEVDYLDFPDKSADTLVAGDTTLQPNYFVRFGVSSGSGGWVYDGATRVSGTKANGLRLGFLRFEETSNISKVACVDNSVQARPGSADTFSFYGASGATNLGDSVLGPNYISRLTGSGTVQLVDSNLTVGYRSSSTSVVDMGRGHTRVAIPDDSFVIVRHASLPGARVIVSLNSSDATVRGVFQVIPGSASLNSFGTLGSNVEGSASGLGGTSGTDGKFTVHLSTDAQFYMENRMGSTLTVDITIH